MKTENNLNEVNNVLFETLRGLKDGKVDPKTAHAMVSVSNSIQGNIKTQLAAVKMLGNTLMPESLGLERTQNAVSQPKQIKSAEAVNQKQIEAVKPEVNENNYALHLGYLSQFDAISHLGEIKFTKMYEAWLEK